MLSIGQTAWLTLLGILGLLLWKLRPFVVRPFTSQIRNLPGPRMTSLVWGNMKEILDEDNSVPQERWVAEYGSTIMYRGFLGLDRLWTMDPRALNHIMTHSADYQKPPQARMNLARILGKGVLFTEGEQHRQQRRVMNPAFGPSQIRELTEIFVEKSLELRGVWDTEISNSDGVARINVIQSLSKMTLDVIGLAGFNYRFNALKPKGEEDELVTAFKQMFDPQVRITFMMILRNFFPIFNVFPDEQVRGWKRAQDVMRRIGMQLLEEKKAEILREASEGKEKARSRDLLTLLLKSNMATDIPEGQRLSDEDVIAQVPTFLVAGHETTSTATTWCLFALTQAPEVQAKLRAELLALDTDTPSMDQLNNLPYLDCVVRETLRVHAPVPTTTREATRDDVIPVAEPFVDRHGVVQDSIRISKGTPIFIPILAMNRSTKLWGPDAAEFRPERWESLPEAVSSIPGVWGHLLTFLGGPRACIGYRFSLIEMKALVYTLVRAFEFELAVPVEDIQKKSSIVQRPVLRKAPEEGSQMPLLVRRVKRT
ncbi:cytochrome P450 [Ganoderma sinense ZZ0214-1]|uniref:Cytochrome P450 n=1 Tax=Ganoderma sinense ZZ0214-1 TaxID=1077348 RepID=A0A2G8S645_9APHY|nr:cytochrome P450 [Ganoderma sinense ZZ0214-1]